MQLESPPEIPERTSGNLGAALTYLPMMAGGGAMVFMFAGPGARPITYVAGAMYALSMVGMMLGSVGRNAGEKKRKINAERRDYARYLGQVRRRVRNAQRQQREALLWRHPSPDTLWSVPMSSRLWERRPRDDDFGVVRLGVGVQQLAIRLIAPETKPIEDLEPVSAGALRRFMRTHKELADLPVAIAVRKFARVSFSGDTETIRGLVRAMLAELAVFHSPDELRVAVCAAQDRTPDWEWVKWLPHALHPGRFDAAGQIRLFADNLVGLEDLLGDDLKQRSRFGDAQPAVEPHFVVVLDGGDVSFDAQLATGGVQGVTVLDLSAAMGRENESGTLRLTVRHARVASLKRDRNNKDVASPLGTPDQLGIVQVEALARELAPYRMSLASAGGGEDALARNTGLVQLLGLGDPEQIDPAMTWRRRAPRDRLRVPFGVSPTGEPIELDLKEPAQDGNGPHGLCIGATGSGKSELLRTLVLGLAITHSSEILNFVLVDFKGGATFDKLKELPHTSAVITNLDDNLSAVDRMRDAINGELNRRQELLRDAGGYASHRDYEQARETGAPLQPMPSLLVIVDEFSELLTAKPDFIDLFIAIGRIGRSLGVHLLLASQRLEEGRLRGLDTYLSYRIGLRTFSSIESRVVLGVGDAYELPKAPGHGYLKIDSWTMPRFRAAYVSGAYNPPRRPAGQAAEFARQQVVPYSTSYLKPVARPRVEEEEEDDPPATAADPGAETVLEVAVKRLAGQGPPAHRVWLPPLDEPPTLDQLLPPLSVDPKYGLTPAGWPHRGRLNVPLGIVDQPYLQRRDPLSLDLAGGGGHVVVVGGPHSGKSTAVRSLIASMALTHTPEEVQVYCLDFGGGTLSSLLDLPHVGSVATRAQADLIRRTIAELETLLDEREKLFTARRVDSMPSYRRLRAEAKLTGDRFGDAFLVVDGWGTIRGDFEELEKRITNIAARGLNFGVHVVVTAQRWMEVRPALRDLMGTRVELRLGDSSESEIDRRTAENIPEKAPGRGITKDKLHFLSAIPRVDGDQRPETLTDGIADLTARIAQSWPGLPAPPVRRLPELYPYTELPRQDGTRPGVPIGIDEDTLAPVYLDFAADQHFLVFGETECGKTNLLRVITHGITTRYSPNQAKFIVLDPRFGLGDAIPTEHKLAHGYSLNHWTPIVNDINVAMEKRLPPPDIAPEKLKSRDWWHGPDLYLVIDDYELVASGANNPLIPLLPLISQGRDIGFHLIIARAFGGAGRALFDPVIQRIKELAMPGLIMSGNRDEGVLLGTVRGEPLPQGRGRLVTRRATKLIQTAVKPTEEVREP